MSELVPLRVQECSDDVLCELLPESYRLSRDVEEIKKIWQPVLQQELAPVLKQIKDATMIFLDGQTRLSRVVSKYERDERAEAVVHDFVKGKLPWAELRQLLQQFEELVPPSPHPARYNGIRGRLSTAPPTNPPAVAVGANGASHMGASSDPDSFLTPSRSEIDHSAASFAARPSTAFRQNPDTPTRKGGTIAVDRGPSRTATTGAKRLLNATFPREDEYQSLETPPASISTPNKRPRMFFSQANRTPVESPQAGPSAVTGVTRAVTFGEVSEEEFIFEDPRCGRGWYVLRCNTNARGFNTAPARFQRHPFVGDLALRHFNSKNATCHASEGNYTVEDIIRDFACRVYIDIDKHIEPTKADVIQSNTILDGKPDKTPVTPVAATPAKRVGRPRKKAKESIADSLPPDESATK